MITYIITFCISLYFIWLSQRSGKIARIVMLALGIGFPAFIAGVRDFSVGTDTYMYQRIIYQLVSKSTTFSRAIINTDASLERSYIIIAYYSSHIIKNPFFFQSIVSLITICLLFWGSLKSKCNLVWLFFLFFFMYYNATLNIQRQAMALGACTVSLAYLIDKRYLFAALALILAYFFHHSAVIFLFILILYILCIKWQGLLEKKTIYILTMIICLAVIILFSVLLQYVVDAGLVDARFEDRYGNSDLYGTNLPISLLALNALNLFIYFKLSKSPNKTLFLFGKYMMLISFLLCFTGLISTFAVRIVEYFELINIMLLSQLLPSSRKRWKVATVFFYIFYWTMAFAVANLGDTVPYKSVVLGIWQ